VNLADDVDNLPDEVKPSQKEKVFHPFHLPILPIAKTLLVKQGKKGKRGIWFMTVMTRAFSCSPMMRQRRLLH
jgi:hypothetical protein